METIRDSAFGKLVRIFSGRRWLRYPEEIDPSIWTECLKTERQVTDEEAAALADSEVDSFGLYTVMSQVSSRVSRRLTSTSHGEYGEKRPPVVIDWRGLDDTMFVLTNLKNPQNWSVTKKLLVSGEIWLLTFAIYIGSAIYTPGIPGVAEQFGVSPVAATLGLTLFVFGYGLGSPALATGAASMGDMWSAKVRDYMIAIWGCFAISAPVMGPLVGGFAYSAKGWTWTIWQLLWVSGLALVLLFFFLPETFSPNILYRRARRIRKITGNSNYMCEAEIELQAVRPQDVLFESLIRPFELCFLEPIIFLMNLYISLIYGILYIFFEAFPIIFGEIHSFNPGEIGLAFMGTLVGAFFTVFGYFFWKYKYQSQYFDEDGNITPEKQLPPACVGCFALPISLFWFGWTGNFESVHWIVPIVGSMFFSVGGFLIFNGIFCYQAHAYPKYAASVLAGNDFMRSSFGAAFPLFASAMFHNLGVGWACTLLGCLTVLQIEIVKLLLFTNLVIKPG
ncbi:hypothetical protein EYZ11_004615 [Aspergillus tanneri]|uniref:Major facilitator superfamily (MFS) profile domain-containing protein n=1 Tax=Aspergillus tanneri TaxID=1220188 RepID=A0A4V3UPN5_9EURO|nr:hypothetical protein EYZ11_004615 [Aspergillus tanneri]